MNPGGPPDDDGDSDRLKMDEEGSGDSEDKQNMGPRRSKRTEYRGRSMTPFTGDRYGSRTPHRMRPTGGIENRIYGRDHLGRVVDNSL